MPATALRIKFTAIRANAKFKPMAQVEAQIDKYTEKFARQLTVRLSVYPPSAEESGSGSAYVRTYNLQRAWLKKSSVRSMRSKGAIGYEIVNDARDNEVGYISTNTGQTRTYYRSRGRYYARWVQGPQQTDLHADTGWRNTGDELERAGGRGKFRDGVQRILTASASEFGAR